MIIIIIVVIIIVNLHQFYFYILTGSSALRIMHYTDGSFHVVENRLIRWAGNIKGDRN